MNRADKIKHLLAFTKGLPVVGTLVTTEIVKHMTDDELKWLIHLQGKYQANLRIENLADEERTQLEQLEVSLSNRMKQKIVFE